ncbi:MAG TPA: prepilin peptidase [Clostridiales bacterium]|nr:prepilin peptidase [Clostridiales bacterium]
MAAGLLFFIFGLSVTALKGLIFCTLLLYATNSDLSTREVTNWIPLSIALTGLIGIDLTNIPFMLLAALFVTLPQLIVAIRKENCYGGGDIKVSAACGFLLGIEKGILGLTAGLLLAVLCTLAIQRIKNRKAEAFPLIPYLAVGFMMVYLML